MSLELATEQRCLFGDVDPGVDSSFLECRRTELAEGAWIEHQQCWLTGHQVVFDELVQVVRWEQQRRPMYNRIVDVPRLIGAMPDLGSIDLAVSASLCAARAAIEARHEASFDRIGVALYRTGRDSVAWHGDTVARDLPQAMVATVSLGEPRKFVLRPQGRGASLRFDLGHGDLLVMGGTCQRTWEHAVPKVAHAGPRIVVMFRPSLTSTPPVTG
ncbi:MAG: alpha-ketoglutarate-dependent dioxygenase AlkB [Acidimicrobiales bacterium]